MRKKLSLLLVALMAVSAFAIGTWKATSETATDAGSTYLDDELLTVKTVFATQLVEDAQEFAGQKFTHYVNVRVNAWPSGGTPTGTEYTQKQSTPLVITAKKDVYAKLYYRRQCQGDPTDNKGTYT